MRNRSKGFGGLGPYTLGGGIGHNQFRVLGFQFLELTEQLIILGVGNQGVVQNVVTVIMVPDLASQLFNLLLNRFHWRSSERRLKYSCGSSRYLVIGFRFPALSTGTA